MSDELGERLRALRTSRGISQRELAKRAGVTHSSISQIEQGQVSPSVSSLKKILNAVPISVADFFTLELDNKVQQFYSADELPDVGSGDVELRLVGYNRKNRGLNFVIETYPPGADTGNDMITYYGEEAGVVIEGQIELTVGTQVTTLKKGDSYYFETTQPHRFRNRSKKICRIVSSSTPGQTF